MSVRRWQDLGVVLVTIALAITLVAGTRTEPAEGQVATCTTSPDVCAPDGNVFFDFAYTGDVSTCAFTANVDWGDGSPVETFGWSATNGPTPAHHYTDPGLYQITVTGTASTSDPTKTCTFDGFGYSVEVPRPVTTTTTSSSTTTSSTTTSSTTTTSTTTTTTSTSTLPPPSPGGGGHHFGVLNHVPGPPLMEEIAAINGGSQAPSRVNALDAGDVVAMHFNEQMAHIPDGSITLRDADGTVVNLVCGVNARCTLDPAPSRSDLTGRVFGRQQTVTVIVTRAPIVLAAGRDGLATYPVTATSTSGWVDADEGLSVNLSASKDVVAEAYPLSQFRGRRP